MNDLLVTGLGREELVDHSLVVSATVGPIALRTVKRYRPLGSVPGLEEITWSPGTFHVLWQPITVNEVLKGHDRVAVGDELMMPFLAHSLAAYADIVLATTGSGGLRVFQSSDPPVPAPTR